MFIAVLFIKSTTISSLLKSNTLKTAQDAIKEVVMMKIANLIECTPAIICPGPLFPGWDDSDISKLLKYKNKPNDIVVAPRDPNSRKLLLKKTKCKT